MKDYKTAVQWIKKIKYKFFKNRLLLPPNTSLRGLAFKNNCFSSLSWIALIRLCIRDRFFIQTSVMVALVHIYNFLSALRMNSKLFFMFFTLQFKIWKVWKLWVPGGGELPPCPPLYTPLKDFCASPKNPYFNKFTY